MAEMKASVILSLIDRVSKPVKKIESRFGRLANSPELKRLHQNFNQIGQGVSSTTSEAARLGTKLTLAAGAASFAFKRLFLDTASEFERFQTVLETVEGSTSGAQAAMDWVSDFATTTPYELAQVTDAFVKLRSYGLDPINGLLRTLGDTSAAMDKPLMQAVEAMADAVNGEYERLKEFGIKAFTEGSRTAFVYTDKSGEQVTKVVDNRNRQMIQSTLQAIWSERYGGAMDKLSKTWTGMMSNLSDQWTRFANMVMDAGVFDWLKDQLRTLLDRVNKLAESGKLREIAEAFGRNMVEAFKQFASAMKATWSVMQTIGFGLIWVRDLFGSWKPLVAAVAAVMAGPLILALTKLSIVLATTPIGWFITAVSALAGLAYVIYRNWGSISEFFAGLWRSVKGWFSQGVEGITHDLISWSPGGLVLKGIDKVLEAFGMTPLTEVGAKWIGTLWDGIESSYNKLTRWLSSKLDGLTAWLPDWAKNGLGIESSGRAPALGSPALSKNQSLPMPSGSRTEVGGVMRIEIDSSGRPAVRELTKSGPMDLHVDLGLSGLMP